MTKRPRVHRWIDQPRLWAWLPYLGESNRAWLLEELGRIRPKWVRASAGPGHWEVARTHLWTLVDALATKFGAVDVYLEFSLHSRCDERCQRANPDTVYDCVCACLGENHGGAASWKSWRPVGETTLVSSERTMSHWIIGRGEVPPRLLS